MKKIAPADILKKIKENKYALIVAAAGLAIILLGGHSAGGGRDEKAEETELRFDVEYEQQRLEDTLEEISGAGTVKVLLSVDGSTEAVLACDDDGILVVSAGSGVQQAVERRQVYPDYMGAVVVCQGADSSAVRLEITEAVSAFTGLSSDRIIVIKMK